MADEEQTVDDIRNKEKQVSIFIQNTLYQIISSYSGKNR